MLKDFLRRKAATTLSDALTPPSQQRQQQSSADPLAPPERSSDPRIIKYKGGYRNDCWLWKLDEVAVEEVQRRVWRERRSHSRPPQNLVNKCGRPRCVKSTHLANLDDADYRRLVRMLELFDRSDDDRACVSRSAITIQTFSHELGWNHREWTCVLEISRDDFEAGIADYKARMAKYRERRAAGENAPPASEPPALTTAEPAAAVAPSPVPPPPEPPPMPVLLKVANPLGKPENLTAQLGSEPGQVVMSWTPAKNAEAHGFAMIRPNTAVAVSYQGALLNAAGAATFGEVAAGRWHFAIIAGARNPDGSGEFVWSQQSDWVSIEVP